MELQPGAEQVVEVVGVDTTAGRTDQRAGDVVRQRVQERRRTAIRTCKVQSCSQAQTMLREGIAQTYAWVAEQVRKYGG